MPPLTPQGSRSRMDFDPSHSAEGLFETKPVAAIRTVAQRAEENVKEKRDQLRSLVGESYRDLITSSDTIASIAGAARKAAQLLASFPDKLHHLESSASKGAGAARAEIAAGFDHLHRAATLVHFLLECPEALWACLDAGGALEAARTLRLARCAQAALAPGGSLGKLSRHFPFLAREAPKLSALGTAVADHVSRSLASPALQTPASATLVLAAALASHPHLQPLDLLRLYLDARLHAARATAARPGAPTAPTADGAGSSSDDHNTAPGTARPGEAAAAGAALARGALCIQDTVAVAWAMFVGPQGLRPDGEAAAVARAGSRGSLQAPPGPLLRELLVREAAAAPTSDQALLGALGHETGGESGWQGSCARLGREVESLAPGKAREVLREWVRRSAQDVSASAAEALGFCRDAQTLLDVAVAARTAVDAWAAPELSAEHGRGAVRSVDTGPRWEEVAVATLGEPWSAWDDVCNRALASHAESVAVGSVKRAHESFAGALSVCLRVSDDMDGTADGREWRDAVLSGMGQVEEQLRAAMSLAVGLQEGASGVAFASGRSLVRAPGLYGKVQESVQAMAADVLTSTRDLGPALARSAPESREQASEGSLRVLAAGRAVLALCGGLLPIALGSPDQWAGAVGSRAGTRGRTVPARATSRTDPPAVGELRRVGASCVDAWAAVRGRPLGEGAAVDLIADPMLAWDGPMPAHVEVELRPGLSARLPSSPSPAALRLLIDAATIARDATVSPGSPEDRATAQALTASVALSFLTNLRSRLTKGATLTAAAPIGVTESGALQLALDCHVVAGPAMTDATSSDGSRAVSESLRQTLQVVSSPLDPIDWAAYEAPLKNLASQALAGVSHLVGLLGSNASGSVTRAASGATPTSTLGPTPAVPRFAYLPFSAPGLQSVASVSAKAAGAVGSRPKGPQSILAAQVGSATYTGVGASSFATLPEPRRSSSAGDSETPKEEGGVTAYLKSILGGKGASSGGAGISFGDFLSGLA